MSIGVYTITHLNTGLFYIGSTGNYLGRRNSHMYYLRQYRHHSPELQEAFVNNPRVMWNFIPMESITKARDLEKMLVHAFGSNSLLCNRRLRNPTPIPTSNKRGRKKGNTHSDETKQKMAETRRGKPKTRAWSDKIADSRRLAVVVDGVKYRSITEAAKVHGISIQLAIHRIKSNRSRWEAWRWE